MENAEKNTFLWERGREAEQDLGALTLEGWCTYTNTHTDTHTCAPVAAGGRWASGSLQATHMLWLWAKMWPWLTTAFSTFATWSLQSWQVGTTILPSCWFPVTWCPKQAGTVKDLVLPHHCPMAWRALPPCTSPSISFWNLSSSGLLCRRLVWNRNVSSEFDTKFPDFGWLLCGTCTVLCALALDRDFTPLYPAAASRLSRELHWASVSPWLWTILSWKDHQSVPPHL